MSKIVNVFKNIFTVTQRSATASQPHLEEGRRKVDLSETRPKNRLRGFFSGFKGLFKRKDKNIASRTATFDPNQTPMRNPEKRIAKKILSGLDTAVNSAVFDQESNVTSNYVLQYSFNNITFSKSYNKFLDLNTAQGHMAGSSDHLMAFCGGNTDQARRLSVVLTKNTCDIVGSAITGKKKNVWESRSFTVSKRANGDINVTIQGLIVRKSKATLIKSIEIRLPQEAGAPALSIEHVDLDKTTVEPEKPKLTKAEKKEEKARIAAFKAAKKDKQVKLATTPEELTQQLSALCGKIAGAQEGSPLAPAWPDTARGATPTLNIVNDYIDNYEEIEKNFMQASGQNENSKDLYDQFQHKKQEASDHLTEFCGGNKNQAQRLSALLGSQVAGTIVRVPQNVSAIIERHSFGENKISISLLGLEQIAEKDVLLTDAKMYLPAEEDAGPVVTKFTQTVVHDDDDD